MNPGNGVWFAPLEQSHSQFPLVLQLSFPCFPCWNSCSAAANAGIVLPVTQPEILLNGALTHPKCQGEFQGKISFSGVSSVPATRAMISSEPLTTSDISPLQQHFPFLPLEKFPKLGDIPRVPQGLFIKSPFESSRLLRDG